MSAGVDCHRVITGRAKRFTGAFPRMPGLTAAMLENDHRAARASPGVTCDFDPSKTPPNMFWRWRSLQTLTGAHNDISLQWAERAGSSRRGVFRRFTILTNHKPMSLPFGRMLCEGPTNAPGKSLSIGVIPLCQRSRVLSFMKM